MSFLPAACHFGPAVQSPVTSLESCPACVLSLSCSWLLLLRICVPYCRPSENTLPIVFEPLSQNTLLAVGCSERMLAMCGTPDRVTTLPRRALKVRGSCGMLDGIRASTRGGPRPHAHLRAPPGSCAPVWRLAGWWWLGDVLAGGRTAAQLLAGVRWSEQTAPSTQGSSDCVMHSRRSAQPRSAPPPQAAAARGGGRHRRAACSAACDLP